MYLVGVTVTPILSDHIVSTLMDMVVVLNIKINLVTLVYLLVGLQFLNSRIILSYY